MSLGNRLDADGEVAVVGGEDVLPALLVEVARAHVVVQDLLGHVDLLLRHHRAAQVALHKVLEAEEDDVIELAASRLEVRVDVLGAFRVLLVVRHLVRVGGEDDVVEPSPVYVVGVGSAAMKHV